VVVVAVVVVAVVVVVVVAVVVDDNSNNRQYKYHTHNSFIISKIGKSKILMDIYSEIPLLCCPPCTLYLR